MTGRRVYRPAFEVLEDRCVPATYTVTKLTDNALPDPLINGSLRWAIDKANTQAGLDTIVFKAGLEGTIKLKSGQLSIEDSLVLTGPGPAKVTIDGDQVSRIFSVIGPSAAFHKVTLSGLTLFNGFSSSDGGAIVSNADLTLAKMVLQGNSAPFGGAIDAEGKLTIKQSRLIGNVATQDGGAIEMAVSGDSLQILKSVISGNFAGRDGGGMYTIADTTIRDSTIANNAAGRDGGGLQHAATGSLTIDASTIANNQAGRFGGGAFTSAMTTTITGTRIASNRAESTGGGLASTDATTIRNSTISGNVSLQGPAGGLSVGYGSLTMVNCTVSNNRADTDFAGGILLQNALASEIRGSTIAGNSAATGGGLSVIGCPDVDVVNSTISGNRASNIGGGFFVQTSSLTAAHSTIAFNRAGDGGGIAGDAATLALDHTISAVNAVNPSGSDISGINATSLNALFCLIATIDVGSATLSPVTELLQGLDPLLAPLAKNGGPTETHALKKGGPAINAGGIVSSVTTDQRGGKFKRRVGSAIDIGALERQ